MSDLAAFLLARIAEDEKVARDAADFPWERPSDSPWASAAWLAEAGSLPQAHIARHDPGRVLAECEAKRRIVEAHARMPHRCPIPVLSGPSGQMWHQDEVPGCWTLLLLAQPYADHPDYDPEWATA